METIQITVIRQYVNRMFVILFRLNFATNLPPRVFILAKIMKIDHFFNLTFPNGFGFNNLFHVTR